MLDAMYSPIESIVAERRAWRRRRAPFFASEERRDRKVTELCENAWKILCTVLHREVVRHNSLGKLKLGIRRDEDRIEVHPAGKLSPVLTVWLEKENFRMAYCSLLHEGSVMIGEQGGMTAPLHGTLLLPDLDGRLIRFGYVEAAQYLLQPVIQVSVSYATADEPNPLKAEMAFSSSASISNTAESLVTRRRS